MAERLLEGCVLLDYLLAKRYFVFDFRLQPLSKRARKRDRRHVERHRVPRACAGGKGASQHKRA